MSSEGIADTPRELPESWIETTLGDALKVVGGGTPSASDPSNFSEIDGVPWITPADLSGHRNMYISRGRRNLSQKGYKASSAIILPSGSVVYSSRAPIGYVAIASNDISTNQGFKSFIIPEGIYNKFLYFYLKSIKDIAEQNATGTTFKELSGSAAALLPLVLPPLAEQVRIADKLDALLARVEAGRERLERVPKLLKRFRQSVLSAAVSGELTNSEDCPRDENSFPAVWEYLSINKLIQSDRSSMKTGPFGLMLKKSDYVVTGVPIIGIENIGDYKFLERSKNHISKEKSEELADYEIKGGDVIISRSGTVGEICVVPSGIGEARFSTNIIRLRLNQSVISPEYFAMLFKGNLFVLRQVEDQCKGSTRIFLNQSILSAVTYPVPPLSEQNEIIRRVESLFAIADRIEAKYAAALTSFDRLTPALLAKAFRGELVPQDPNDEPASVLLDRIRAAREAEGGKRGRGRPVKAAAGSGDGTEVKRRGRPPGANAQAGAEGAEPKRRGRPPRVREAVSEPAGQPAAVPEAAEASASPRGRGRPPGPGIPQASSFEDALRKLEEQKLARAQGARQVGLFDDAE